MMNITMPSSRTNVNFPPGSTLETLEVGVFAGGDAALTVSFAGAGSLSNYTCQTSVSIRACRLALVPDYGGDGRIEMDDMLLAGSNAVFRLWINDDSDTGDLNRPADGADIPGAAAPDHADAAVNGKHDLLDFFPVMMDIRGFEELCGQPDLYRLKQAAGAVNVVYSRLGNYNAGSFLTAEADYYGPGLNAFARTAITMPATAGGTQVSPYFVSWLRQTGGIGVFLVEGACASTSPLVLEAVKNGAVIASCELPMRVAPVEDFFANVNLRDIGGATVVFQAHSALSPRFPAGPDEPARHFVFAHGYNVSEAEARGWHAEMFKRLWQSGSRARFHAVTWRGNEGQTHYPEFVGMGWRTPDYYLNVRNAFSTAPKLASYVQGLGAAQGDTVVVAGHSLGNMVVSSAIQDHGMGVDKYFMLNAAVPSEAYDGDLVSTNIPNPMVHDDWGDYNAATWSANWHALFPGQGDDRGSLTWRGRFSNVPAVAYNFYSSGDEVFEVFELTTPDPTEGYMYGSPNVSQTVGRYSWQKQELFKGRTASGDILTSWLTSSDQAGWGFRGSWITVGGPLPGGSTSVWAPTYSAAVANGLSLSNLLNTTVFHPNPPELFQPSMSASTRASLLAYAIPALSQAAGTQPLPLDPVSRNVDMNDISANGWWRTGQGEKEELDDRWLHSDLKETPFLHVHPLFERLVTTGELK